MMLFLGELADSHTSYASASFHDLVFCFRLFEDDTV